jgi:hypothetical protein
MFPKIIRTKEGALKKTNLQLHPRHLDGSKVSWEVLTHSQGCAPLPQSWPGGYCLKSQSQDLASNVNGKVLGSFH